MASRTHAVVLSDIHIGNGMPTCWYQPSVHNDYLTVALRWIANDERIRDVVFLGDMFDVWTYPPSVEPPTMMDILKANGDLLGPTGPLAQLVKALPGHVAFMPGNHDGTIGALEIAQLNTALGANAPSGPGVGLIVDPSLVWRLTPDGPRTVVSHGHHWCMFNAPDPNSPWDGHLPVGHLVSRAIAYKWSKKLTSRQTVADLPGMGNPGLDVSRVRVLKLIDLWLGRSDDIVTPMLDYVCDDKVTGLPANEPIVLPGGRTTTVNEAKRDFANLFADWAVRLGRRPDAKRAAAADLSGRYLAWFAQRLALQTGSDLVVMGHTHVPLSGVRKSPISYVNNGYECVSKPDLRTHNFTFTLIDLGRATAKIYKVVKRGTGFAVGPADVPMMDSVVQPPAVDYSCYVRITNRSGGPLRMAGTPRSGSAFWVVPPPDAIPDGGRADLWLQDELMKAGADGDVTYTDSMGGHRQTFEFACPVATWNRVRSPVHNYETKSGNAPWRLGKTDRIGHPLQVRFTADPAAVLPPVPSARAATVLTANADYFAITRPLLGREVGDRGKVMCHARLISSDRLPLIDTTTEPGLQPGHIRLRNPPNHLIRPADIYAVDDPTYGLFQYVLISPNGPMAPPVFGGFLFLPRPGMPSLHLVTFNVARLDVSNAAECGNAHHAEQQVARWISEQSPQWCKRLECVTLTNNSRNGDFAYSPCNPCCDDLAHFLHGVNRLRPGGTLAAALSWGDIYNKAAKCHHPMDKTGIKLLKDSGWTLSGPVPRGVDSADGMTARPGATPCLSPELVLAPE